jgi:hypothetical protein
MRMRSVILSLLLLTASQNLLAAQAVEDGRTYRIGFPDLSFDAANGERVESLELLAGCAEFRGISLVPRDWSVDLSSPSGGEARLTTDAGHGINMLTRLAPFNGVISIEVQDSGCFKVSGIVKTSSGKGDKEYKLSPNQFTYTHD